MVKPYLRRWIPSNVSSETDSGGTLPGGEDGSMRSLLDVFKELRLRGSGITAAKDVDVTSNPMLAAGILRLAPEHTGREQRDDIELSYDFVDANE